MGLLSLQSEPFSAFDSYFYGVFLSSFVVFVVVLRQLKGTTGRVSACVFSCCVSPA